MKPSSVLTASILLNLGLVLAAAYLLKHADRENSANPGPSTGAEEPSLTSTQVVRANVVRVTLTEPARFDWHQLESADYKVYIANLKAVECREQTIRDIILADVNKLFSPRLEAIMAASPQDKFWEAPSRGSLAAEREIGRQVGALNKEKAALLDELLGGNSRQDLGNLLGFDGLHSQLSFLPEEKRAEVMEAFAELQEAESEFGEAMEGLADAEDREWNEDPSQKRREALAAVLTPEELTEYNLRHSEAAGDLRKELDGFNPTEAEFREMFKYRQLAESDPEGQDPAARDQLKKDLEEARSKLRERLGEERFAEFERQEEPAYRRLVKVTEEQGLPRETAVKVHDMMKASEEASRKIRLSQNVSAEQKQIALNAIAAETEKAIAQSLGPSAFKAYKTRDSLILKLPDEFGFEEEGQ